MHAIWVEVLQGRNGSNVESPSRLTQKFSFHSITFESKGSECFGLIFELVFMMTQTQDQLGLSAQVPSCHSDRHVFAVLSKQIKDVRVLKDDGGCFYVLLQAAVAPIGLEERLMGLKHSACSQLRHTLSATSKSPIIYILAIHSGICSQDNRTSQNY